METANKNKINFFFSFPTLWKMSFLDFFSEYTTFVFFSIQRNFIFKISKFRYISILYTLCFFLSILCCWLFLLGSCSFCGFCCLCSFSCFLWFCFGFSSLLTGFVSFLTAEDGVVVDFGFSSVFVYLNIELNLLENDDFFWLVIVQQMVSLVFWM